MKSAKEYYRTYLADNNLAMINYELIKYVNAYNPAHVLEFGAGTAKNNMLDNTTVYCGLDISFHNLIYAHVMHEEPFLILGDESHLRHLCNFDIVFTCSVLDHIEDVKKIVEEFKRIANKAVFLAETNEVVGDYYYPHDYESMGFKKIDGFKWLGDDDAIYYIWEWIRPINKITE